MKTTRKMIKDSEIWGGMNRPDIDDSEADVIVFGIPFDGSVSFREGAKEAPRHLRSITYTISPVTEYFEDIGRLKVKDIGDIEGKDRNKIFAEVTGAVKNLVKGKKFFTMIGGDHSTTIPVLRGINDAIGEPFGIIHFDAHFDLCEDIGGDILSHGCTERRALELENIAGPENFFFVGIRSAELDELKYIGDNKDNMNIIGASELSLIGVDETIRRIREKMASFKNIYITIDIDCLDPAYAAGTGTPQFGGLTSRELLSILRGVFELPVIGFDIVEVAPGLDPSLTSVFAARKLLTECWGHYARKNNII